MTFTLFKFLHILMMFIAVSAAVIPEVVLHWVSRSGDVGAIRVVAGIAARLGKLLPVFFVGGASSACLRPPQESSTSFSRGSSVPTSSS